MSFPLGFQPIFANVADWFVAKITESGELIDVSALDFTKSYIFFSFLFLLRKEFKSRLFIFLRLFPIRFWVSIGRGKGPFFFYRLFTPFYDDVT